MASSSTRLGPLVQTTARRVLVTGAAVLALVGADTAAAVGPGQDGVAEAPWDRSGEPQHTLRSGSPTEAGLVGTHLEAAVDALERGTGSEPLAFPGAVALAARDGVVALHEARGHAVRFADDAPTELPADHQREVAADTIFDLASLTKLFTGITVVQLAEDGAIDLDAPVADVLPRFAEGGKAEVTPRHLLTHTGGLPAWLPLWSAYGSVEERIEAALTAPATSAPGTVRVYSDLGFIALGELVEAVTGQPLDEVVAERITTPLGMSDTGFTPGEELRDRIAATEYQPLADRGMVHGEVHDENAWALGGVSGHAGLFSTAEDLAVLAQTLLNGGVHDGARILEAATVEAMMAEQLTSTGGEGQALAFERGQRWLQDAMWSPDTVSHTGFTGTSLVIDPHTDAFAILLTNRVHPSREGPSINPERREVARAVTRAVPVRPRTQDAAWFSGMGDQLDVELGVDLDLPDGPSRLTLDLWYDLADEAELRIEARSSDGWQPLPGTLRAGERERPTDGVLEGFGERRWWRAELDLTGHSGPTELRIAVEADDLGSGRGVYVDRVRVDGPRGGPIFHDQNPHDQQRWQPRGFSRVAD